MKGFLNEVFESDEYFCRTNIVHERASGAVRGLLAVLNGVYQKAGARALIYGPLPAISCDKSECMLLNAITSTYVSIKNKISFGIVMCDGIFAILCVTTSYRWVVLFVFNFIDF